MENNFAKRGTKTVLSVQKEDGYHSYQMSKVMTFPFLYESVHTG